MPNRILRDWTDSDLRKIEDEIARLPSLEDKLEAVNRISKSLPTSTAGNYLGVIKWWLNCKRRRIHIQISNRKGTHTFKQELELIKSVGGKCAKCGITGNPTIDHIVPVSKGGSNGIENLQVLCGSCNSRKGGKYA